MKTLLTLFILIALTSTSYAYILNEYNIHNADRNISANIILQKYKSKMKEIEAQSRTNRIEQHKINKKIRLNSTEKNTYKQYWTLKNDITFWKYVCDLKQQIISLLPKEKINEKSKVEADKIAKIIIEKIYELSGKYKVKTTALVHNMLINSGLKRRGHCYHYTSDILMLFKDADFKFFDINWGTAWEKNYLENNAVIITAKDEPLSSGLAIDPWRKASKPYFIMVKEDYYPWVLVPKPWPIQ